MSPSRRAFLALNGAALGASLLPGRLLAAVESRSAPMPRLDDWAKVRAQFRLAPDYVHLAGFYISSHPAPVRAAIDAFRQAIDDNPFLVVERGMFESQAQNLQRKVREDVAAYLGGSQEEIALTPNTTTGLALVYHGLPLKPGDEVLVTRHDHYSHHEAIRFATERNGASVRRFALFDDASAATVGGIVSRVREAVRPATRVLGITWVHSSTGMRLPVRQIADALRELNRDRPPDERVLLGVTRQSLLEIAKHEGIDVAQALVRPEELAVQPEVFLSGTTAGVLPVESIDGRPVGDGRPGPLTQRLGARLREIQGGRDPAFAHWLTPADPRAGR